MRSSIVLLLIRMRYGVAILFTIQKSGSFSLEEGGVANRCKVTLDGRVYRDDEQFKNRNIPSLSLTRSSSSLDGVVVER